MKKTRQINYRSTDDDYRKILRVSKETRLPMSEVIRMCIDIQADKLAKKIGRGTVK